MKLFQLHRSQSRWLSLIRIAVIAIAALGSAAGAVSVGGSLPEAVTGQPYNYILAGTGGSSPYTHVLSSGSLPVGLALSSSGVISGSPLNAGMYHFGVQTTDSLNQTGVTDLSLRVTGSSNLEIITMTLPAGRIGVPYDFGIVAQGGAPIYTWDLILSGGSLGPGLAFSPGGRIVGTPTAGGIYPVTIRVTDADGNSFQSALSLRIDSSAFMISTNSLAGALMNVPYSQGIAAIGGTVPYLFEVASGTMAPGLSLSSGGVIAGTPTSAGVFSFNVRSTDAVGATAQASFSIVVSGSGPRVVISSLPTGILNQIYNATLSAQGGTGPYTFSLMNGSLPAGLTLSLSGVISGTPTASGVFPITVRLGDSTGQSSQADILININSSSFSINSVTPPDGFVNSVYNLNLTSSGGTAPANYAILSGTLPPGLTLSPTGTISGTASTGGSFSFVVRATDAGGATAQAAYTIRILSSTLVISQEGLANGQVGQVYSSTLSASGGVAPYTFNFQTGSLPPGLTVQANGNISGTPTTGGFYYASFRVLDANLRPAEITLPIFIAANGLGITTLTLPSGQPNQPYSTSLLASGGTPPYTFQLIIGSLPTGLSLSPAGVLSGNLTQTSNGAFTVRVTDSLGATSIASYLFNVNNSNITLSPSVLSTGQIGKLYSTTFTSSGGVSNYTYSLDAGALPPGLTLSSSGTLSGTPTTPGTYVFNLKSTDASLNSAIYSQVVTINSSQLGFENTVFPNITIGTQYFATFTGIGGTAPYSFSLVSGTLPPGITLGSNGNLTGSATASGSYPITVKVTDATGASASMTSTLVVNSVGSALSITTSALATARRGLAYTALIVANGGRAPYTFELGTGTLLPAGLTLSPAGLISGTPTVDGTTNFVVRAQDANGTITQKALSLSVSSGSINISIDTLPNGIVGITYGVTLAASGGSPTYSFSLAGGSLPPGLTLSGSGVLAGTPTLAGSFPVVIRVSDSSGAEFQKSYTMLVGSGTLAFTNVTLPFGYVGQNYRSSLYAAGGVQPWTFSIANGSLPSGLTLDPSGIISGIPTVVGQSSVTFRVVDAAGASATNTLVMGAIQSTIGFGFTSIPTATVGQGYGFTPTGSNGTDQFRFSVLGGLPPGIKVRADGALTGIPTQAGSYNVLIRAQDGGGAIVEGSFPFLVAEAGFRISSLSLPDAQIGQAYSQTLTSSGGTGTVSWILQSGALPAGIQLSSSGLLSGTTTVAGSYPFTVRATDASNASTTAALTLLVSSPIVTFMTSSLPSGTISIPYSQSIGVFGGTGPYSFVVSSGALPAGLTLSQTGLIAGTPTGLGNFPFEVRATDTKGQTSTAPFLIGISAAGAPSVVAVVSAANYTDNGVTAGEIVVLYGNKLGPVNLMSFTVLNNMVATTLGGTRVLFDGVAAPMVYVSANQVAAVAPFNIASKTNVKIVVEYLGEVSATLQVPVRPSKPALFTVDESGTGPGSILNQDGKVNTELNPAEKSSIVSIFVTGVGQTDPASQDGQIVSTPASLAAQVKASINGQVAEVVSAGGSPGRIPGLAQIDLRLPSGVVSGMNSILISVGANGSTGNVTVFVK